MKVLSFVKKNKIAFAFLFCILVYTLLMALTNQWPWVRNPYNSYALQARSWLDLRADLGRNYSHLELAFYNGRYYVSFPPVPSLLMLPAVIFNIPDGFVSLFTGLISIIYVYKLSLAKRITNPVFFTLFLMLASNILLVSTSPWVWFFAQNVSFLFTIMALYYASIKKGIPSLLFWALSIGARPFQIVYLPLLIYILTQGSEDKNLVKLLKCFILPILVGSLYMIYNYLRFGSVFEFGHNYLPEFLEAPNGQFHYSYIPENLKSLIRLPDFENGRMVFPFFNGMSVFLCFPLIIPAVISGLKKIQKTDVIIGFLVVLAELVLITSHKTMGGFHFGNRYFIDVMPAIYYVLLVSRDNKKRTMYLLIPLFIFGLLLNVSGITQMYMRV